MYKILTVREKVRVPPAKFGKDINEAIKESLQEQIEGKLYPDIGIFLAVTELLDVKGGDIYPEDGAIFYIVEFKGLAFVPELNEMVVGEVVDVTAYGAFVRIGPVDAMVHISQVMDDKVAYNDKQTTLSGRKTGRSLNQNAIVRGRIVSVSLGRGGKSKIGLTMRQPALGAMEWITADKKERKRESKKE